MGLDMYLKASKHLSNYDFRPEEKELNKAVKEAIGLDGFDDDTASVEISVNVGYWRKANAIHKWFVDNCQEGVDECQETYVSREDLEKLKAVCLAVLKDNTKALEILPSASGFFFGGTDYDEWYFKDVEETIKIVDKTLALSNDWFIEYQSSW